MGVYGIGGIFHGGKISQNSCFRKNYTQKTKNLYGSHLIFDGFAKFLPHEIYPLYGNSRDHSIYGVIHPQQGNISIDRVV